MKKIIYGLSIKTLKEKIDNGEFDFLKDEKWIICKHYDPNNKYLKLYSKLCKYDLPGFKDIRFFKLGVCDKCEKFGLL